MGGGGREDADYNLEAFVSAETTLIDHLAEQLTLAIADPVPRMIGQYLIDLVDEAGYLVGDVAMVAERLGAPLAQIEGVLAILQGFDPPGVCARNLSDKRRRYRDRRSRGWPPRSRTIFGRGASSFNNTGSPQTDRITTSNPKGTVRSWPV